jgi:methionine sulfoxide reductase heme-binding subunit
MVRLHPVVDRAGRFAPLKATVFVLLFVPGLWTAWDLAMGNLGPRPFDAATHETGTWTIRLIFLSLLVTPLRELTQWPRLLTVRRMVGVAAFVYGMAHLALFIVHERYDLVKVASEIVLRIYLTIGFVALLGLTALAATSTDGMIRRLGSKKWRRLHQGVYLFALLALIHFFMQSKHNVYEPLIMAGLYFWLMAYRFAAAYSGATKKAPLSLAIGLAVLAAVLTAFGEALYYHFKINAPLQRILATNLDIDFDIGMRPAWVVLAVCGVVILATALRLAVSRWRRLQPRPA